MRILLALLLSLVGCKKDAPKAPAADDAGAAAADDAGAAAAVRPKRGDGPGAGIADFRVNSQGGFDEEGDESFNVGLLLQLDHSIGFTEVPVLEVGARSSASNVARAYVTGVTEDDELVFEPSIDLPAPGAWSIDLYADGKFARSVGIDLSKNLCAGGQRMWSSEVQRSAQVLDSMPDTPGGLSLQAGRTGGDDHFSFTADFSSLIASDQPAVAIVEWIHKGVVKHRHEAESGHLASAYKELDRLSADSTAFCVESTTSFALSLPEAKAAAMGRGGWLLRVHRSGEPSFEASFTIEGDESEQSSMEEEGFIPIGITGKEIPTPPAVAKELGAKLESIKASKTWRERAPELRAVVRNDKAFESRVALTQALEAKDSAAIETHRSSLAELVKKHGGPFKDSERTAPAGNRPPPLKAEPTAAPKSGCNRRVCSSYPALSSDSSFVVYRIADHCIYEEISGYGKHAAVTRHYKLGKKADDSDEVPSRDMSGYQPLVCGKTGFRLATDDNGISVVSKSGKKLEVDESSPVVAVCEHPVERTVLVVHHQEMVEGLTGEPLCVEAASFEVVSY